MKTKYKKNFILSYLWFPFSGILLFLFLCIYDFVYLKKVVDLTNILITLIPFIIFSIASLPFYILYKGEYYNGIPFLKGIYKYISILCIILSIVTIYTQKENKNIPTYSITDTDKLLENNKNIYIIFTKDDCNSCNDMKRIYTRAFNKKRKDNIFYIKLDNVDKNNSFFKKNNLKIEKVHAVIHFKDTKENKRIVGKISYNEFLNFIKE